LLLILYAFLFQQEPFNGQNTNFSGGGYGYNQGNGVGGKTKLLCVFKLLISVINYTSDPFEDF